jgi:hypothetical protein
MLKTWDFFDNFTGSGVMFGAIASRGFFWFISIIIIIITIITIIIS